jgi:hypothetical protein
VYIAVVLLICALVLYVFRLMLVQLPKSPSKIFFLIRKYLIYLKVLEMKKESQSVLVALVSKLLEKLPLKYSLVRHAACLDPRLMGSTEKRDHCIGHMRQLL